MRKFLFFMLAMFLTSSAVAETQTAKQDRLRFYLTMSGMPGSRADLAKALMANVFYYDTAVELLAASPSEGTIGYAIDTNTFYFRSGASWSGSMVLSGITGANGGEIDNDTNNVWTIAENSENITVTFGTNTATFASGTAATFIFTPASAFTGDVTLNGGAGALTFGAASSSVVVPDNSGTALLLGSTGQLGLITIDSTDTAEEVNIVGTTATSAFRVDTGFATFDEQAVFSAGMSVTGDITSVGYVYSSPGFSEGFGYGASKGLSTLQIDGTAFDGTAGVHNIAYINNHRFAYAAIVGQTLDLAMTATGLNIAMDQTDNDGVEIFTGVAGATGRPFTVGTDAAFQSCVTFTITDGNGTDDFHVGFRKAEAFNATVDNYADRAGLGIVTVADPALVQIETNLAGAGTVTTSTTDTLADATSTVWCTLVSAAGVVTYTIDGVAPTATAAYTFSDGMQVIPFIHLIQANVAQTGALDIENWAVGYQ